ncbi:hypothetical protein DM39_1529 [Burkholderia cenocepacia]|uniref:Uncharacterized protein n=1 Tax=Burkholderia cenocepacia TaxID=95486 RepID=A0AAN0VNK9_9BURK|nr:hypothetical protein DM39_1529 [Burkholderia cenocepacia]
MLFNPSVRITILACDRFKKSDTLAASAQQSPAYFALPFVDRLHETEAFIWQATHPLPIGHQLRYGRGIHLVEKGSCARIDTPKFRGQSREYAMYLGCEFVTPRRPRWQEGT